MTTDLKIAIQNLYEQFSNYPLRRDIEGCPCCVHEVDKQQLSSKVLTKLTADDLSHYVFKAMTTWGDTNDFKHFLPRIFELQVLDYNSFDAFLLFDKLSYAKWKTWGIKEQECIQAFLIAWWADSTLREEGFQGENLPCFINAFNSVEPLLEKWHIAIEQDSFKNLVHFIFDSFQLYKVGKDISIETEKIIQNWLLNHTSKLESGFYYYEKTDADFAQKISYCYDIVQRATLNP
jgi:hypothetical protein